jgi:hypothetical protein
LQEQEQEEEEGLETRRTAEGESVSLYSTAVSHRGMLDAG